MSGLAKDAASFKSTLHRQDYSSWHSQPKPPDNGTPEPSSSAGANGKKKRPKNNIVYSQPADTGTGTNVNTQLVYAVEHLKSTKNPMRLEDIAAFTETPLDTDPVLLDKFKAHDRINYDPRTDTYSYRHDYVFTNKASLLTEVERQTKRGSGLSVRTLRESWKDAPAAIEELEKDGEVLVTRTQKDGQLRMVFWNEIKPNEEEGGMLVEQEFRDAWHKLTVPNEVDLLKALESEGMQATASSGVVSKPANTKKKGKKSAPRQRQVRITNTHLRGEIDLSRDFTTTGNFTTGK